MNTNQLNPNQMSYKTWIESVKRILLRYKIITESTKLTPNFFIEYYNEGMNPIEAIKEDFGEFEINYNH